LASTPKAGGASNSDFGFEQGWSGRLRSSDRNNDSGMSAGSPVQSSAVERPLLQARENLKKYNREFEQLIAERKRVSSNVVEKARATMETASRIPKSSANILPIRADLHDQVVAKNQKRVSSNFAEDVELTTEAIPKSFSDAASQYSSSDFRSNEYNTGFRSYLKSWKVVLSVLIRYPEITIPLVSAVFAGAYASVKMVSGIFKSSNQDITTNKLSQNLDFEDFSDRELILAKYSNKTISYLESKKILNGGLPLVLVASGGVVNEMKCDGKFNSTEVEKFFGDHPQYYTPILEHVIYYYDHVKCIGIDE